MCHYLTFAPGGPLTRYAYLGDDYGTAEFVNSSGYLFRQDGQRKATLVSYKDPRLLLLGHVFADAQLAADLAKEGYAGIACSRAQGVA
jgi:hypothetical protein